MVLVALTELVVAVLLLYLGATQVVLPLWRDTPLFPIIRRERRLQHELAEATENVVEAELEKKIAETAQKAESVRRAVRRPTRPASGTSESVNQEPQTEREKKEKWES